MNKQQGKTWKMRLRTVFTGSSSSVMYRINNNNKDFLSCIQDGGHRSWLLRASVWSTHSSVYFYLHGFYLLATTIPYSILKFPEIITLRFISIQIIYRASFGTWSTFSALSKRKYEMALGETFLTAKTWRYNGV